MAEESKRFDRPSSSRTDKDVDDVCKALQKDLSSSAGFVESLKHFFTSLTVLMDDLTKFVFVGSAG